MAWKKLEYSRTQVVNAGKTVRDKCCSEEDMRYSLQVINNWRAAHAYPMHVIYMHLRKLASGNPDIIVAERMKRLESIITKLKRESSMSLWTMQDLGGCRFIVPTIKDVYQYAELYSSSNIRHKQCKKYDYITLPKNSGYRSLHLVYQYFSDKKDTYNNNMLVEIQFRTKLQHLWATAIETMSLITNQDIKAGECEPDIIRFFALISSLFAMEENSILIPNTPTSMTDIVRELHSINRKNNYINTLATNKLFAEQFEIKALKKFGYILLIVDLKKQVLKLQTYDNNETEQALIDYNTVEQTHDVEKSNSVLVRVSSISALKIAYPNYFQDITSFLNKVQSYLMPN